MLVNGRKTAARITLKSVWAFAICRGTSGAVRATRSVKRPAKGTNRITPTTLNAACAAATRSASAFWPIAAKSAVAAVPMFAPKMIGIALESGMRPLAASDNASPITAALERTSAVNTAATRRRISGWPVRAVSMSRNRPLVASGAVPSEISFMPRNRKPKPSTA